MSEDWKIKTGTLYFHLRELEDLIEQDDNKRYKLTTKGKQVCQWFVGKTNSPTTVTLVQAYSFAVRPVFYAVEQRVIVQLVIAILAIVGLVGGAHLDTLILGPMIFPAPSDLSFVEILLLNLGLVTGQILLITIASHLLGTVRRANAAIFVVLGNGVPYLFVAVVLPILLVPAIAVQLTIPFLGWLVLSILSQLFFALIVSGALVLGSAMKPERAMVIAFVLLYLSLMVSMFFL